MKNKLILMTLFASAMLAGMDDDKYLHVVHSNRLYRAQTEIPEALQKLFSQTFGEKKVYPVFVVSVKDNVVKTWYNFDLPIKLMMWDDNNLYVMQSNDKSYAFELAYLQQYQKQK